MEATDDNDGYDNDGYDYKDLKRQRDDDDAETQWKLARLDQGKRLASKRRNTGSTIHRVQFTWIMKLSDPA